MHGEKVPAHSPSLRLLRQRIELSRQPVKGHTGRWCSLRLWLMSLPDQPVRKPRGLVQQIALQHGRGSAGDGAGVCVGVARAGAIAR